MQNEEIDKIIGKAVMSYIRRPDYDGRTPVLADCDIILVGDRDVVMLCAGVDILAYYCFSPEGHLRYMDPAAIGDIHS
jgi:hypothetical protein